MSAATYRLRVGWNGRNAGVFRVGNAQSTIAPAVNSPGYDRIGYPYSPNYDSDPLNTIPDGRYGATSFMVTRGRDNQFSNMLSGQLEVTLNDIYPGRYNPKNTASVLWDATLGKSLVRPMRPCCLDVTLDSGASYYQLFNGWLDEEGCNVDIGTGEARFLFKDMFLWLDRARSVTIASTGSTTVGVAIGLCLDAIGFTNPALRSLDLGSTIPDFSVSPGESLLSKIAELLQVDLGVFFHSRSGVATYYNAAHTASMVSIGTFVSVKAGIPGTALSTVRNTATATRQYDVAGTLTDGPQQYYEDSPSVGEFGPNAWEDVKSTHFVDDAAALAFCTTRVTLGKEPTAPVWTYTVSEGPTGYLALILAADILDRTTINAFGSTTDYHVQKIVHRGGAGELHQTDWVLAERM